MCEINSKDTEGWGGGKGGDQPTGNGNKNSPVVIYIIELMYTENRALRDERARENWGEDISPSPLSPHCPFVAHPSFRLTKNRVCVFGRLRRVPTRFFVVDKNCASLIWKRRPINCRLVCVWQRHDNSSEAEHGLTNSEAVLSSICRVITLHIYIYRDDEGSLTIKKYQDSSSADKKFGGLKTKGRLMYHGTKFHTNSVKPRRNRRERKGLFSCVPSPFYRVCMGFCASVTVSASVSVASVNQALGIHPGGMGYSLYSDDRDDRRIFYGL